MSIIGCDLHSRYQVIAMLETEIGEIITRRLEREGGEAERFCRALDKPALIGIEAAGYTQWFERLVAELGHELWVGHPAEIRARAMRRQKTDTRDAEHLLDLLVSKRFPRVWVPTVEGRDSRQTIALRGVDVGDLAVYLSGDSRQTIAEMAAEAAHRPKLLPFYVSPALGGQPPPARRPHFRLDKRPALL